MCEEERTKHAINPRQYHPSIRLVCNTDQEVYVRYAILCESTMLRKMVDNPAFIECENNTIKLPINYRCLQRIVEYLHYKYNYRQNRMEVQDFKIEDQESLDLLEVSAFLRL
ncbi:elongin-C [Nematocida parisii]|uniref:Elongin-C n=1 Tax=Nematocida parisii (strain ERTm3) TaxID=935791 RepID=I3EDK0_NEMP3|nr:uncharacterized protein NEPG_01513 [Nematocida parisii ERTm1]EIJ87297.1 hypothetical protein NEQG_02420 [Nematocida parisii ERTm3]KAI5129567.1 elongin-C [Nematocida parisii]EIJ93941.1 hypothetical protein NEPG_01513 [Nematocida parisii ERTm1]KAI5130646.1 elongin-C [Nematocida parisii]KAI5143846.1 elongin-C [Nematocida parisii]|eukprot:XP_013059341.1 hypothetical protein NEPG_01513 [Nematocida parisii ERTm1]